MSPSDASSSSDIPHILKYNITSTAGGVLLRIWEPAPRDETRVKPFLFMLKYRMASEADAQQFLADYLTFYKAVLMQTSTGYRKTVRKHEADHLVEANPLLSADELREEDLQADELHSSGDPNPSNLSSPNRTSYPSTHRRHSIHSYDGSEPIPRQISPDSA